LPKQPKKIEHIIIWLDPTMSKHVLGFSLTLAVLAAAIKGIGFEYLAEQGLERPGYVALAILLIAAILWITEAIPLFVTSLGVLFLSIVWLLPWMKSTGIQASKDQFLSPFFSDVIVLFLGGFALSAALHKRQIDEWLAARIIERTGGSLGTLTLGIMGVTAFFSMWLSNTATAAMMLAMVLPIASKMSADDLRSKAVLLSVPFAANIGGLGTPIGSPPNAIAMQYMQSQNIAPSFAQWMMIGVPGVVIMLLLAWGTLLLLWGEKGKPMPEFDHHVNIRMDASFWAIIAIVIVTAIGWMTTSMHGLSSGTIGLIPVLIFFGSGILDNKDVKMMSWDVLLMMGGGLCLGTVIATSGLADWLVHCLPISGVSTFWLTFLFGIVACFMSSLMSNTATANLLLPIIIGMSVATPAPIMIGIAFGCSLAMPLPISTPPNAMAFSSDNISVIDMAKPGIFITVIGVLLALTTGYWWWQTMGLW
jgi:sodium-dependent dicarboxylate transporter 2/3/5